MRTVDLELKIYMVEIIVVASQKGEIYDFYASFFMELHKALYMKVREPDRLK